MGNAAASAKDMSSGMVIGVDGRRHDIFGVSTVQVDADALLS